MSLKQYNIAEDARDRMLKENKNFLCIICGGTGSGKTYTGLKLAHQIDPEFSINRVVFTAKELMEVLNNGGLRKGSVILFDEAGVGMPARDWYSIQNKLLGYVLQTFRHRNLGVIFTTPSFDFIDTQARKLFHAYLEPKSIDKVRQQCRVKLHLLQYNPSSGKIYHKRKKIYDGKKRITINTLRFNLPPKDLIDAYEAKKDAFTKKLNKDILKDLNKKKEKKDKKSFGETLDMVKRNPKKFLSRYGKINPNLVAAYCGVGNRIGERVATVLNNEKASKH